MSVLNDFEKFLSLSADEDTSTRVTAQLKDPNSPLNALLAIARTRGETLTGLVGTLDDSDTPFFSEQASTALHRLPALLNNPSFRIMQSLVVRSCCGIFLPLYYGYMVSELFHSPAGFWCVTLLGWFIGARVVHRQYERNTVPSGSMSEAFANLLLVNGCLIALLSPLYFLFGAETLVNALLWMAPSLSGLIVTFGVEHGTGLRDALLLGTLSTEGILVKVLLTSVVWLCITVCAVLTTVSLQLPMWLSVVVGSAGSIMMACIPATAMIAGDFPKLSFRQFAVVLVVSCLCACVACVIPVIGIATARNVSNPGMGSLGWSMFCIMCGTGLLMTTCWEGFEEWIKMTRALWQFFLPVLWGAVAFMPVEKWILPASRLLLTPENASVLHNVLSANSAIAFILQFGIAYIVAIGLIKWGNRRIAAILPIENVWNVIRRCGGVDARPLKPYVSMEEATTAAQQMLSNWNPSRGIGIALDGLGFAFSEWIVSLRGNYAAIGS